MIAITGGGTGGHLAIAKAVCEAYNQKDIRPFYIGSTNGQDQTWFKGYPGFSRTLFLETKGVVNQRFIGKFISLFHIIKQAFTCKAYFKTHGITKVFSVGGYSAAPAALAAVMCRIPLYIHEQNAAVGRLNKLLRPFAKTFFSSYDAYSPVKDYPVSYRFFEANRPRTELRTILFMGGSQGARFINELAMKLAPDLIEKQIAVIHQCGKADYEAIKAFYEDHRLDVDLFDFSPDLHVKMKKVDFAVSRAGAGSLWELTAAGIPAFYIPYPYAAADHQYYNAKTLADRHLAFVARQGQVTFEDIRTLLDNLDIKTLSHNLTGVISPNGAMALVDWMENGR